MLTVCLSTIPPRHAGLAPVLASLRAQDTAPDRIIVSWCRRYARFPGTFGPPPVPPGIELHEAKDLGPLTKLAPLPVLTGDVIWCDDDCLYGPGWITALLAARGEAAVVAASTFPVRRLRVASGDPVAQGFAGVLAPTSVLEGVLTAPEDARWADDVWISGVLAARGVQVVTAPAARAEVAPQAAPVPLQTGTNRAAVNQAAVTAIRDHFGIWPAA
ncbi:glycosyltransferase family A protein [Pseudaestuariivita atlantica]|uniref:Glycosyltransferase n=1 Tax=Pseudaestuariivita atlantica TaxID=1317121 RepID=A0A0L1JRD0_9RHOB|nr:glycosyltransferase family A protein [Pseudaestuariivita atlantica]KNG94301.1 hypothetical protein ATO11_08840 [Pseudaestuariivita atlantica]